MTIKEQIVEQLNRDFTEAIASHGMTSGDEGHEERVMDSRIMRAMCLKLIDEKDDTELNNLWQTATDEVMLHDELIDNF